MVQDATARAELRWEQQDRVTRCRHILGAAFAVFVANPSAEAWQHLERAMTVYQDIIKG